MTLRTLTAGLLVGVLGLAGRAAARAVEHHTVKQVHPYVVAHPEAFPVAPNTGLLGLLAATLVLGLVLVLLYDRAVPRPPRWLDALGFGGVCWAGVGAP